MGLFVLAWLFGEGIVTYRAVTKQKLPPAPRALLVSSGLFAALGALGEIPGARGAAAAAAWALDLAILLQVLPGGAQSPAGRTGWQAIGNAGNTVIIPTGTAAASVQAASGGATSTEGISGGSGASATANQSTAKEVIKQNSQYSGWDTGSQWSCLVQLWNDESGWSATATNKSSGAFGIAQSLHGNKGGQGGNEYSSSDPQGLTAAQLQGANAGNPADQIAWGLAYILSTYGDPCAALQHEQSESWY